MNATALAISSGSGDPLECPGTAEPLDDVGEPGSAFRLGGAGCDGVHPHPGCAELVGPELGQQVKSRLAGAVEAGFRGRGAGCDSADVDHAAVPALDHAWNQLLHQNVRCPQVDVEMGVEVGIIGVECRCEFIDARVVDQDVHRRPPPRRACGRRRHCERSAATNRALPPTFSISWTALSPRSALRPCTTTSAPCRASSSAIA